MNPENSGPDAEKTGFGSEPEVAASEVGADATEAPISAGTDSICDLREAGVVSGPARMGTQGTIEAYDLIRELGRGGMGTVLLARNSISGELVAVKTLRAEFASNPQAQERFNAEARHLRALRHPNIVPVLGWPESERVSYYVMPYCERGSLARLRGKPLGRDEVLGIAEPVAAALDHAHKQGVFHGDLKPGNILLGNEGQVYLADFGLARDMANPAPVKPGQDHCEGTMPYISPAVAAGEVEDTRRDVYGLGALMYEMLTGRPPYQGSNSESIRAEIRAGPPPRVLEVNPKADPELVQVTEWAMAREQRRRYANVADLMSDLRRVKEGRAPLGPDGRKRFFPYPSRILRRHWRSLLVVCLGVTAWVLHTLRQTSSLQESPESQTLETTRESQSQVAQASPPSQSAYVLQREPDIPNVNVQLAHSVIPAELNGLPGSELVVAERTRLLMLDASGNLLATDRWALDSLKSEDIAGIKAVDLDQDGRDEVLVSTTEKGGTKLRMRVVNHQGLELTPAFEATGPPHDPANGIRTSWFRHSVFIPPHQSMTGRGLLVIQMQTLRNAGPRALLCFDVETRTNVWRWDVGPVPEDLQLVDLNGDGRPEILMGSNAPGNGAAAPDGSSSDDNACVFALLQNGEVFWRHLLVEGFGTAKVRIASNSWDKSVSIYACAAPVEVGSKQTPQSKIIVFGPSGNARYAYGNPNYLHDFMVTDLDQDGKVEVVCSDGRGWVYLLDSALKFIRKRNVCTNDIARGSTDHQATYFLGSGPVVEGKRHIIAETHFTRQGPMKNPGDLTKPKDPVSLLDQSIIVLDSQLQVVASYSPPEKRSPSDYGWRAQMADLDGDSLQEILIHEMTLQVLKMRRR